MIQSGAGHCLSGIQRPPEQHAFCELCVQMPRLLSALQVTVFMRAASTLQMTSCCTCLLHPPATCLIMAAREYWWGWSHKRTQRYFDHEPKLGATGWASLAMCALYMVTGMSGLAQYSLPTNPGEAFKMVDVAQKHKVSGSIVLAATSSGVVYCCWRVRPAWE